MELEPQHQRSNFSQFSDIMWMLATNGDTTIKSDVDQRDMIEFALHLCDIADDCLRAAKMDTDGFAVTRRESPDYSSEGAGRIKKRYIIERA